MAGRSASRHTTRDQPSGQGTFGYTMGENLTSTNGSGDWGRYQCFASNNHGTSLSQEFNVMVAILDDSGKLGIETYSGKVGKYLLIPKRQFFSLPESGHVWMTVSRIDDPNPRRVQHDKHAVYDLHGNLYITCLRSSDALENGRFYKMEVWNEALQSTLGGSYSRVLVDTSTAPIELQPELLYPMPSKRNVNVLEGTKMQIQCIFSGNPDVDVTWSGPATSLATREESGTRLVLRKITKEAAGEHECTGTNRAGSDRTSINVHMHTIPKFTAGGRPSKQTLTEGETATFTCQTTEDTTPQAAVDWMINGVLLQGDFPEPGTEVTTVQNGKNLTIRELDYDKDIKVVQCKVSNKYKTLYIDAPLNVLKKTRLTEMPVNQTMYSNTSQVVFVCRATSDPCTPAAVRWLRDGKALSDYNDPRMMQDKMAGTLTLNFTGLVEVQKAGYSGEYTCTATNGYSTDAHTAALQYRARPDGFPWWTGVLAVLVVQIIVISSVICVAKVRSRGVSFMPDSSRCRNTQD